MPALPRRQFLCAFACGALLIWLAYSLSKLFEPSAYNPHPVKPAPASGPIKPAGGDHADVLVRQIRHDLDKLVPNPALSSLLASAAPTQLENTAVDGPWMGDRVTATSPTAFAAGATVTAATTTMPGTVTVCATTTIITRTTGSDTHLNAASAGDVPARNALDSGILATNLGHVSAVSARPTTQPSAFGWGFAGCWADQPHQPVLAAFPAANLEPVTNEVCVRHCFVHGYTLAATSFGKHCHCGQFLNGTQKLDGQCGTPCPGDNTEICGGDWALSCYSPDGQARGWAQFGEPPLPDVLDPPIVKSLAAGAVDFTVVTSLRQAFPTPGADANSLLSQYGYVTQHPKATLPSGVGRNPACAGGGDGAGPGRASDNGGGAVTSPGMASNPTVTLRPGSWVSPKRNAGARRFPPR